MSVARGCWHSVQNGRDVGGLGVSSKTRASGGDLWPTRVKGNEEEVVGSREGLVVAVLIPVEGVVDTSESGVEVVSIVEVKSLDVQLFFEYQLCNEEEEIN